LREGSGDLLAIRVVVLWDCTLVSRESLATPIPQKVSGNRDHAAKTLQSNETTKVCALSIEVAAAVTPLTPSTAWCLRCQLIRLLYVYRIGAPRFLGHRSWVEDIIAAGTGGTRGNRRCLHQTHGGVRHVREKGGPPQAVYSHSILWVTPANVVCIV